MGIAIQKIDLLKCNADIIAHCCNCRNVMGAGVAKNIAEKYPKVFQADFNYSPRVQLGTILPVELNFRVPPFYCVNLYGQFSFGRDQRYLNYEAIFSCFFLLREFAESKDYSIGMPYKIGCGLAGGNWRIVETMIEEVFENYEPGVTLCQI